jgi:glutathione synthase
VRIGIVLSNAAVAAPAHTTVHLAWQALRDGHAVRVLEPWDFEVDERGRIRGRASCFDAPTTTRELFVRQLHRGDAPRRTIDVDRLDILLLRANPLQDSIVTFGQHAQAAGVRVLNDPRGMLRTSQKGYLATLPGVPRPRTLVTRSPLSAERFLSTCPGGVVVKPARACGGRSVARVPGHRAEDLLRAAFEAATLASGDGYAVVQEYLAEADDGEKRLVWLDGQLVGGYLRMRAPGEFRHNLKVGGEPRPAELTRQDHALCAALTPHLRDEGVWLAGIDVIGGRVVEVNTLNPGGVHWSDTFSGAGVARRIIASLEPGGALASPLPVHIAS